MIIPAASTIEMAIDFLKKLNRNVIDAEIYELTVVGSARFNELIRDFPDVNIHILFYLLGLQTARVLLQGIPDAVKNKIEI